MLYISTSILYTQSLPYNRSFPLTSTASYNTNKSVFLAQIPNATTVILYRTAQRTTCPVPHTNAPHTATTQTPTPLSTAGNSHLPIRTLISTSQTEVPYPAHISDSLAREHFHSHRRPDGHSTLLAARILSAFLRLCVFATSRLADNTHASWLTGMAFAVSRRATSASCL
jgi:hypothetical protein